MDPERIEYLVIGSGAGGAPLASTLAEHGRDVVILEKGPLLRTQPQSPDGISDFKRDELLGTGAEKILTDRALQSIGRPFFSSHVEPDLNDEPHVYDTPDGRLAATIEGYTAQVVGGGTQLYGGVSLRFTPDDFRLGTFNRDRPGLPGDPPTAGLDWPIGYDDLEPYYTRAEERIGINGTRPGQERGHPSAEHYQEPLGPNPISAVVEEGMANLGLATYRTPLAVITRDHPPSGRTVPADRDAAKTAFVNRYGDPLGLKSNTWVALLQPLMAAGALQVRANCHVTHLALGRDRRIAGVHYRDPAGRERVIAPGTVVLACSAIETVRLLLNSAARDPAFGAAVDPHDHLGRYFLTHCFGGASCQVAPELRADKSRSLDSDWATDHGATPTFIRGNGLFAGGVIYNNTSDAALPLSLARTWGATDLDGWWSGYLSQRGLVGQGFERFLDENFGRRLSVTFVANQVPQRDNRIVTTDVATDKWGLPVAHVRKGWHAHDRHLMEVFTSVCGEILERGGGANVSAGSVAGAPVRIANHIMGGARFGGDRATSVLDPTCRSWDVPNLYVTDGSFMPTSGSANPTLTIQANSFRVGDILVGA